MAIERHYFPGNNTPKGFFSYYSFILKQREAKKIVCIKGGPGTGKSTFMRKIGETFLEKGENVDFLHCSADEDSLDGILLTDKKIALIDGTSPHVTDPITPGAVDEIINLGEFWNEEGIVKEKESIIDLNEECSRCYTFAYSYLEAVSCIYSMMENIYANTVVTGEIYKLAADTVYEEFGDLEITIHPGEIKKFFASAITANGIVNYLPSLLADMNNVYLIDVPVGFDNSLYMQTIVDGAVFRGLDVELYYCPISPERKIEHIIIPQLKTAFVTTNKFHDVLPWELCSDEMKEIVMIDMGDFMDFVALEKELLLLENLNTELDILLNEAVKCLENAKKNHAAVESLYIPNMNFTEINALRNKVVEKIEALI